MSPKESSNSEPDTPDPATQATRPANVVQPSDGTEATPGPVGAEAAPERAELPEDPDELRKQIEETRAELGDTVEALSAKTDVKGQAKAKVDEQKAQVKENPTPVAAAAGGIVALLLLVVYLRRRD